MSRSTQGYDVVMPELVLLKQKWPFYFFGLRWPRMARTIKVALADEQVMALVSFWAMSHRIYDQGIAWGNKPIDERNEEGMQQRLAYWSRVWDNKKVKELHEAAYFGFQHPTEEECQDAERKAEILTKTYGTLIR